MRHFRCRCGSPLYFENVLCLSCNRALGFEPATLDLVPLEDERDGVWTVADSDRRVRLCRNYRIQNVCNWLVDANDSDELCIACRLNQTIPNLDLPNHRLYWARLETAKRRALYTVLRLGLPIVGRRIDPISGLAFAFLADFPGESPNPTGHHNGLVTINVAEADDLARTRERVEAWERYRTLLGHFRHELGHVYWPLLVANGDALERYRIVFGDERNSYRDALQRHYDFGPRPDWQVAHITPYASAHPWEDWAESWAHYMHMVDAVETASSFGMIPLVPEASADPQSFKSVLDAFARLIVGHNALNRGMGLEDAYPFVHNDATLEKLRFVHERIFRIELS